MVQNLGPKNNPTSFTFTKLAQTPHFHAAVGRPKHLLGGENRNATCT
jgi:hypothetical protein